MQTSRRTFLEFMGRSVVGGIGLAAVSPLMGGCYSNQKQNEFTGTSLTGLQRSTVDDLVLADGLKYHVLAKWTDVINSNGDQFGAHCDYVSYIPFTQENPNEGYLWVNHEYFDPTLTSNFGRGRKAEEKTLEQIRIEQKSVGGSILHVKKSLETGAWAVVPMSAKNRRFDALTEIPFSGGHRVFGSNKALGTLGNCCGGQTPWGTFLTCEENYSYYYGSEKYDQNGNRTVELSKSRMAWDRKIKNPPEHYGWVCEIDPRTHKIVKHPSLGRFAHEGAKVTVTSKQQAVVYMGDDAGDEHFYKFIADRPGQLVNGKLYVARMNSNPGTSESGVGEWVEISLNNPLLKGKFKNHTELMVRTRDAAKILGATPLDRPEGCDIDPLTKNIFLACTNNSLHARNHGYVLKVKEEASAFEALRFEWEVFVKGGGQDEMSCPDNLMFDPQGNLWIATDMPEAEPEIYGKFGNNSLFFCPTMGKNAGRAIRVASGPKDSELTGIWFSPDKESIFLSVQHPGSTSKSSNPSDLTSHWPDGGTSVPKSSVVVIQGPLISQVMSQGS